MWRKRKKKDNEESQSTTTSDENNNNNNKLFACYLLTSLNPRFKGHTYIGFTVNPRRRIRQHNGEIGCGAWRTKTKRPWEMVLCIHGFPTNITALQFEWAWQHPRESLAVREAASAFKSLSGVANKIKIAYTMLTLPAWKSLNVTVNYFSTKYMTHTAKCPSLPQHMKVKVSLMDELPCYTERNDDSFSDNEEDWHTGERNNDNFGVPCNGGYAEQEELEGFSGHDCDRRNSGSSECNEECQRSQPSSSSRSKENSCQEYADPPVELSFSAARSPHVVGDAVCLGMSGINKANDAGCNLQTGRQVDSDEPHVSEDCQTILPAQEYRSPEKSINVLPEVEIIDICTPSPDFRTNSRSKRRKTSRTCPNIIDLTKSPIFIQL